ncbi:HAD family hydrolase [Longirhabdus pacifica]|uniref:HAD family hydrolase n=1 Tax=Longirhabdus pacifica TaxID=2305227 RepID=UPI0010088D1C|nr:HAD family hydrolase [Longirhabdus pacifica]
MVKQHIFFDLDDTLVHCNKYYREILHTFTEELDKLIPESSFKKQDVLDKQLQIDMEGIHQVGLTKEGFPESLVNTYVYFAEQHGEDVCHRRKKMFHELGYSIYDRQIEPYPQMAQSLEQLQNEGHHLYLYTGGDEEVQKNKINQLQLGSYFQDRVYVTKHKTYEVFDAILNRNQVSRNHTWMIGNSERTDIMPALKANVHAIHIPAEKEWEYNKFNIDHLKQNRFYQSQNLRQAVSIITEHTTGAHRPASISS